MFITTRVAVLLSIDIISHIAVSWNTKISFKFNPFPSRINNYVHVRLYLVNDGQFFFIYYTCREIYHGKRWNSEPRFAAPMVSIAGVLHVFVKDCVTFLHPQLGPTRGIIDKIYHRKVQVQKCV